MLFPQIYKYDYQSNDAAKKIQRIVLDLPRLYPLNEKRDFGNSRSNSIHRSIYKMLIYPCRQPAYPVENYFFSDKEIQFIDIEFLIHRIIKSPQRCSYLPGTIILPTVQTISQQDPACCQ